MHFSILRRKFRQKIRRFNQIAGAYLNSTAFRIVAILFVFSLFNIYSVSGIKQVIAQLFVFVLGSIIGVILSNAGYFKVKNYSIFGYVSSVVLLLLVLVVGSRINGACRWIKIGHFSLQPSEFIKPALILMVALFLDLREKPASANGYDYNIFDLLIPLGFTIIPLVLILKQPDLGTGIICFLIVGSILFFMKIEKKTFITILCCLCVGSYVGWHHLKPYQKERFIGFLNPDVDFHGKNWQSHQAIVAFGSGGLLGKGLSKGPETQLGYLPENESDFAMASIGEEHGFVVVGVIILLSMLLVFNLVKIAFLSHDRFSTVFSIGMAFWIGWQTILNMLMVLGCIPVVGIPYPMISSGGSSLLSILTSTGILISIDRKIRVRDYA